ncbi:MAG: ROK family protein [Cellulosilyticaceae bacterium]
MSNLKNWVGVDQGCTKMLMMAEFNGEYIEKTVPTGMQVSKEYVSQQVNDFIAALPFEPEGVGMGVVGLLDGDTLKSSHLRQLEGLHTSMINGKNVKFINDVKAAFYEEERLYPPEDAFVLIMAGSGFAMGAREQGKSILGTHGWAGELGSNPYPIGDKIESLDDISGGYGLLAKSGYDIKTLLQKLEEDDPHCTQVIKQGGMYFGLALSDIIHTFNPKHIVIGGSTVTFKGYMEEALDTAKKYTLPNMFEDVTFYTPRDVKRIVALGARRYAFDHFKC